jgi:signal transduction histidine kinase
MMVQYFAREKDISLETHLSSGEQIFRSIYGDERRYLQILNNFLSNAIKFSPRNKPIIIGIKVNEVVAKSNIE